MLTFEIRIFLSGIPLFYTEKGKETASTVVTVPTQFTRAYLTFLHPQAYIYAAFTNNDQYYTYIIAIFLKISRAFNIRLTYYNIRI